MTTAVRSPTEVFSRYQPSAALTGPVLIATDTSPDSDAAFTLAELLAERTNEVVHVVSAMRPFSMPMYAFDAMPVPFETDAAVRIGREGMVKQQMERLVPNSKPWPVSVQIGEPTREIVDHANALHACVILVGRGRHGPLERSLMGESVLRMLQLGDTPVLAVESTLNALPRNVVIATDFTAFSLYAAQVALKLVAPDAMIHLVHVAPPFAQTDGVLQERAVAYSNQARHGFMQLHEQLHLEGAHVDDILVEGNASDALLKIVESTKADLVVSATHGYGFLRRMILGSVAAELVRHAPCSVLCVPGSARTLSAARTHSAAEIVTRSFSPDTFDAELNAFGTRNRGRLCTVEIDSNDVGAQILGHALTIVGATFDHLDQRVSLMFGASGLDGQHLTHAITNVSGIDITTDKNGIDQVLRIVHTDGHTLLLME